MRVVALEYFGGPLDGKKGQAAGWLKRGYRQVLELHPDGYYEVEVAPGNELSWVMRWRSTAVESER